MNLIFMCEKENATAAVFSDVDPTRIDEDAEKRALRYAQINRCTIFVYDGETGEYVSDYSDWVVSKK